MISYEKLTKAIESLESAAITLPVNSKNEVKEIIEELIYLRLRVSQGDAT